MSTDAADPNTPPVVANSTTQVLGELATHLYMAWKTIVEANPPAPEAIEFVPLAYWGVE